MNFYEIKYKIVKTKYINNMIQQGGAYLMKTSKTNLESPDNKYAVIDSFLKNQCHRCKTIFTEETHGKEFKNICFLHVYNTLDCNTEEFAKKKAAIKNLMELPFQKKHTLEPIVEIIIL